MKMGDFRKDYKLVYDKIRNLITTKKAEDWAYIIEKVKEEYGQDISDTEPVFLTPNDFLKKSEYFDPDLIFFSCHAYKKTPVLVVEAFEDLEEVLGGNSADEFRMISHFIE